MEVRFSTIVTRGFLRCFAKILWDQGSCRFIYFSILMKYVPWMISNMIVEGDRIPRAKKLYILVQKWLSLGSFWSCIDEPSLCESERTPRAERTLDCFARPLGGAILDLLGINLNHLSNLISPWANRSNLGLRHLFRICNVLSRTWVSFRTR